MKRSFFKTLGLLTVAAVICMFMLAMKVKKVADDIWQQLGISQNDADLNIRSSFQNGAFYYYGAKNAAKIAAGDRISVIWRRMQKNIPKALSSKKLMPTNAPVKSRLIHTS